MLTPEILEIMEAMRSDSEGDWPKLESVTDFSHITRYLANMTCSRETMAEYVRIITICPYKNGDVQDVFDDLAAELDLVNPDFPARRDSAAFELLKARKGKRRNVFLFD